MTTGKTTTKTFVGKDEQEAFNKALTEKLKLEENGGIKIITKANKSIIDLVTNVIDEDYRLSKTKKSNTKKKIRYTKKIE